MKKSTGSLDIVQIRVLELGFRPRAPDAKATLLVTVLY